ncbi:lysis protein [Pseudomonas sp. NPDC090755]|uniref:lysis protein n=1 Tax=Pseudomonas sp. NPDC090755 TaxID=3364481 RepID=UPI00383B58EC
MSPGRSGVLLALLIAACGLTWQIQGWRLGRQLAQQAETCAGERRVQAETAAAQLLAERQQRQGLEQRLQASDQRHYQELVDARDNQARLRDRLATADLRLSVLVERGATGCAAVPAAACASGLDHEPVRARLDPAHAGRIIAITDQGDRGLIALRACQAYVQALLH